MDYDKLPIDKQYALISGGALRVESFKIHPLTLREISDIGFGRYQILLSYVLISKNAIDDLTNKELETIEDFDVVVSNCAHNEDYRNSVEEAMSIFLKEDVNFLEDYSFFSVGNISDMRLINRKNFEEIADAIRLNNMLQKPEPKVIEAEVKESAKMRELRLKQEQGRKMMAEAKNEKQTTTIVDIIATVGTYTQDFAGIMDWTLYQLYQAHASFLKKEDYRERYDAYLAGGDPKKLKLDTHWSRLE